MGSGRGDVPAQVQRQVRAETALSFPPSAIDNVSSGENQETR